ISSLFSYQHKVLYYGPRSVEEVKTALNNFHNAPSSLKALPDALKFDVKTMDNSVYVIDYDMKQAEIMMLSNGKVFDAADVPVIRLYNTYFGSGMSSILFQDLRESKALAYSTFSRFTLPTKKGRKTYNESYIGSQADKLAEAIKGLKDLLTVMPKADNSFAAAKEML